MAEETTQPLDADPRPAELRTAKSLLLVNTGDGKGKSSAAFGVMLRALALEWPVAVVQFLKSGDWKVGEEKMGRKLGVDWHAMGDGFTWDSDNIAHDKAIANEAWAKAKELINSGANRLVILDEITYMLTWEWLDLDDVITTLQERPEKTSVICTGRDAPDELIAIADTVSRIENVKHAYDAGIIAKKGIDF